MAPESAKTQDVIQLSQNIELDLRAYELRRDGRALKLERIPMDILVCLVEHRGELVSREQIAERIWGKSTFLDTDNSINGAIRKIRQVLEDDSRQPRFIVTVLGKGYRLVIPTLENGVPEPGQEPAAVSAITPLPNHPAAKTQSRSWPIWAAIGSAVLLVLGSVLVWRTNLRALASPGKVMVAVLPCQNFSGNPREDYLSDGLTEEMIAQLGRLDPTHLGVIARTSVMHYKDGKIPLAQIARELSVQYVLEGSLRRTGDRVRITAQLIDTRDQTHVWAREYDREAKDVLTLQGDIAQEIVDEIQTLLGEHRKTASAVRTYVPRNDEVADLYLQGRYFWNKRSIEGFQQAIEYFQQAVAKDPHYAPAYAGLADAYSLLGGYSGVPQVELMAKARAAAQRALELDERLPEAHTAMALIVQNYDLDWDTAEKEFRRAIELNPNYATAHHWYAEHLTWRGRFEEAFTEIERARQLDPLSLIIAADRAVMLYYARDYDHALQQFRSVLAMDPDFVRARMIFAVYVQKGKFEDARQMNKYLPLDSPWHWANSAYIESRAGKSIEAAKSIQKLRELNRKQPIDPSVFALVYASMGEDDEAAAWLDKSFAQHSNVIVALRVDPIFDGMRRNPRFNELLRRAGLAP